jgi:hypothetical protein
MTFCEIAILVEDEKSRSIDPSGMSDAEYARYWSSMTPKERLLKVAEGKR